MNDIQETAYKITQDQPDSLKGMMVNLSFPINKSPANGTPNKAEAKLTQNDLLQPKYWIQLKISNSSAVFTDAGPDTGKQVTTLQTGTDGRVRASFVDEVAENGTMTATLVRKPDGSTITNGPFDSEPFSFSQAPYNLGLPQFPQATTQGDCKILDLESPDIVRDGAVIVVIPNYTGRKSGDRITIWFKNGDNQIVIYRFLYLPDSSSQSSGYKVLFQPLQAIPSGQYEVSYMVTSKMDNSSLSKSQKVEVFNTPTAYPTRQVSFWGNYANGILDSWVIPSSYTLSPRDGVLFQSLGISTEETEIGIYQNSDDQPFAVLKCGPDGNTWTFLSSLSEVQLSRGDLVTAKLEGSQDSSIYLALAL